MELRDAATEGSSSAASQDAVRANSLTEAEQRAAVVGEARSWLRTPYRDGACVKGAGVDCGTYLIKAYANAGMIDDFSPGYYAPQHHLHSNEERYLGLVLDRATEFEGPPGLGDIVMFKIGRVFAHGAIVIGWPRVIHAVRDANGGVIIDNVERCIIGSRALNNLPRKFFTLWPK